MNRRTLPMIGAMLAVLAAIGLAALVAWHQLAGGSGGARNAAETVVAPGVAIGGAFTLTDQDGKTVTDADFKGGYSLFYFGYTFCPDVCPTELSTVARALDLVAEKDPAVAEQVTPVFVTVDPKRDSQALMKDYVQAFYPRMVGLRGDEAATADIAAKFRVYYAIGEDLGDGFYLVNHSSYLYLMGPNGELKSLIRGGASAENVAEVLTRVVTTGS